MILYSQTITPRLRYIADFIGKILTGAPFHLTTTKPVSSTPFINYSDERSEGEIAWIRPHALLFEKGIRTQEVECFDWNRNRCFFRTQGDLPFDIFAAAFYLVSRYEEYLPHENDMYGRYAHESSLAFREKFLNQPLINIWVMEWGKELQRKSPSLTLRSPSFTFIPTYDIDEAWSYLHKSLTRVVGASAKNLLERNWTMFRERREVRSGKKQDPFDSYDWLNALHRKYKLNPIYFFLVAAKTSKYDRNILPTEISLQSLIKMHSDRYSVGIHPSWQTGDDPALVKKEVASLEQMTGKEILHSRQHFIRFKMPGTFQQLINAGIREEYSMGYGSINGFRASVASPFHWYDLERDEQTDLMVYPFCLMDANCFFEQKQGPEEALEELRFYYRSVKYVNGTFVMIWHNTFLGTARLFRGWREVYEKFIAEIS